MFARRSWLVLVVAALMIGLCGVEAADSAKTAKKPAPKKPNPAMAKITDAPGLPRVLLLGDSISIGYTLAVREKLAGKANLHRAPDNCGPTSRGVEKLESWLGDGKWDVIHFNFGLHDLKYMDNNQQQVLPADYEKNLRTIVARLKKTGAKLIWCSTTPVPEKSTPIRKQADVLLYNAAAKKVMDENNITINDLHAFALPRIKEIQLPDNVHFSAEGSKVLAEPVVAAILAALKK